MLSSLLSFGFGSETFEFPAILDDNFDSRLARLLDKAGVPNFTWGYKHLFDNGSMDARYYDVCTSNPPSLYPSYQIRSGLAA